MPREALRRKLAELGLAARSCCEALARAFELPRVPRRIEVYDNSHIQGTNAVGADDRRRAGRFREKASTASSTSARRSLTPGDDFGMMREVLARRFKRLMTEAPAKPQAAVATVESGSTEEDAKLSLCRLSPREDTALLLETAVEPRREEPEENDTIVSAWPIW